MTNEKTGPQENKEVVTEAIKHSAPSSDHTFVLMQSMIRSVGGPAILGMSLMACPLEKIEDQVLGEPVGITVNDCDDYEQDLDRDGTCGPADCDEEDPSINYLAYDIPNDGIDQDCDGADAVDPQALGEPAE